MTVTLMAATDRVGDVTHRYILLRTVTLCRYMPLNQIGLNEALRFSDGALWRDEHVGAYGDLVCRVASTQEAKAAKQAATDGTSLVFERTVLDRIGVARCSGTSLPRWLTAEAVAEAVTRIDSTVTYCPRAVTRRHTPFHASTR